MLSVCEGISHEVLCEVKNFNLMDENFRNEKEKLQFVLRCSNVPGDVSKVECKGK